MPSREVVGAFDIWVLIQKDVDKKSGFTMITKASPVRGLGVVLLVEITRKFKSYKPQYRTTVSTEVLPNTCVKEHYNLQGKVVHRRVEACTREGVLQVGRIVKVPCPTPY